jgi:hypothetical protein
MICEDLVPTDFIFREAERLNVGGRCSNGE